jgi:phage baseplate assembly protein W
MANRSDLYGAGFQYPFAFQSATGGVTMASDVESVRASLRRLLDTAPGEDRFQPDYGCALKHHLFENDTDVLRALIETTIREAVIRWEPRIEEVIELLLDADVDNPHVLRVTVVFRLIQSQNEDNLVYPLIAGGNAV